MEAFKKWVFLGTLLLAFFIAGGLSYVFQRSQAISAKTPSAKEKINWKTSYVQSLSEAKSNRRLLLIDFYADWCGFCKKMEKTTYEDPAVIKLSHEFVCTRINVDQDGKLAEEFNVLGLPTLIFFKPGKGQVKRIEGYVPPDTLVHAMSNFMRPK